MKDVFGQQPFPFPYALNLCVCIVCFVCFFACASVAFGRHSDNSFFSIFLLLIIFSVCLAIGEPTAAAVHGAERGKRRHVARPLLEAARQAAGRAREA